MTELASIQLYGPEECAEFLGLSLWTFNKLCREKEIKAIKIGNKWKVTKENLQKYIGVKN